MKSSEQAWHIIKDKIGRTGTDVSTAPTTNKTPIWFSAYVSREKIAIINAQNHSPSAKVKGVRYINYEQFCKVYPYYFKRKIGDHVSKIVSELTRSQVYIYGMIKEFIDEE